MQAAVNQNHAQKKRRITLTQKNVLLVGIPVLIQCATLAILYLDNTGNDVAVRSGLIRNYLHAIRGLTFCSIGLVLDAEKCLDQARFPDRKMYDDVKAIRGREGDLIAYTPDSQIDRAIIRKIDGYTSQIYEYVRTNAGTARNANIAESERRSHWIETQNKLRKTQLDMQDVLYELTDPKHIPEVLQTESQTRHRYMLFLLTIVASFASLISLVTFAFIFYRTIARKLSVVEEHCDSISRGQVKYVPLSGQDEVSQLDQSLHELAVSLSDAAAKQKAFFRKRPGCSLLFN